MASTKDYILVGVGIFGVAIGGLYIYNKLISQSSQQTTQTQSQGQSQNISAQITYINAQYQT